MYAAAGRVTLALLLFRGGPQDFPYSLALARQCALLAAAASALLMALVLPLPVALATGAGGVAGIAFFTRGLLKARKLDNRFLQVFAAQCAVGAVFALAMWPALSALAPSLLKMLKNPEALAQLRAGTGPALEIPTWASLVSDVLFFWNLAVSARINRHAAEVGLGIGWLLTLASLFVVMGFVVLAQLIVLPLAQ